MASIKFIFPHHKALIEAVTSINQRMNLLIEELKLSTQSFATSIGFSKSTIYNVVGPRGSKPSSEIVSAVLTAYPQVRSEWLISGKGEMLHHPLTDAVALAALALHANKQPTIKPVGPAITVSESDFSEVKFVDVPAEASYLSGFGDREFIERLPTLRLPAMGAGSRELYGFTIRGDSMSDRFSNGDIILGQRVERDDALRWGEVYIMLLNDGLVVKELRRGPDSERFTLHSFNTHFDPYDVLKTEVRAMFRYQASISFNSSNPNRAGVMRFLEALSQQLGDIKNTLTPNPATP